MNAADAIVDAILAALTTAPAVSTGPIAEDLDATSFDETVDEAVSVSLIGSDPQTSAPLLGHPVDWISTVVIECYARRDSRVFFSGRASRALHARVYARLMQDPRLGGVIDDVREPSIATEGSRKDTPLGCTTGTYTLWHRTASRTLDV